MKARLAPERAASREAEEASGLERKCCLGLPIGHAKVAFFARYHRSWKAGATGLTFSFVQEGTFINKARSNTALALVVVIGLCCIPGRLTNTSSTPFRPLNRLRMIARQSTTRLPVRFNRIAALMLH